MKAKNSARGLVAMRKLVERKRLVQRAGRVREAIGPRVSEANAWQASLKAMIERFEPSISRGPMGEISFKKRPSKRELQIAKSIAESFIKKYRALMEGQKSYERIARAAGMEPAAIGEAITRTGIETGASQRLMLAMVEAERILKAIAGKKGQTKKAK